MFEMVMLLLDVENRSGFVKIYFVWKNYLFRYKMVDSYFKEGWWV